MSCDAPEPTPIAAFVGIQAQSGCSGPGLALEQMGWRTTIAVSLQQRRIFRRLTRNRSAAADVVTDRRGAAPLRARHPGSRVERRIELCFDIAILVL
jgi:hypothetical protein